MKSTVDLNEASRLFDAVRGGISPSDETILRLGNTIEAAKPGDKTTIKTADRAVTVVNEAVIRGKCLPESVLTQLGNAACSGIKEINAVSAYLLGIAANKGQTIPDDAIARLGDALDDKDISLAGMAAQSLMFIRKNGRHIPREILSRCGTKIDALYDIDKNPDVAESVIQLLACASGWQDLDKETLTQLGDVLKKGFNATPAHAASVLWKAGKRQPKEVRAVLQKVVRDVGDSNPELTNIANEMIKGLPTEPLAAESELEITPPFKIPLYDLTARLTELGDALGDEDPDKFYNTARRIKSGAGLQPLPERVINQISDALGGQHGNDLSYLAMALGTEAKRGRKLPDKIKKQLGRIVSANEKDFNPATHAAMALLSAAGSGDTLPEEVLRQLGDTLGAVEKGSKKDFMTAVISSKTLQMAAKNQPLPEVVLTQAGRAMATKCEDEEAATNAMQTLINASEKQPDKVRSVLKAVKWRARLHNRKILPQIKVLLEQLPKAKKLEMLPAPEGLPDKTKTIRKQIN